MEQFVKNYRHDDALRASFNALAEKTFGLNFENWYRLGCWGDNYIPYSLVEGGRVIANVSVNRTDLVMGGGRKKIYQLGTVMTDPAYRNRGCIRRIMAQVERDIADADGVYLFANDSVVAFYPKFGFTPGREFLWEKKITQTGENRMENVPMDTRENRDRLETAMAASSFPTGCHMVDNPGLIFFYAAQFLADCVYYCAGLNAWVIAEIGEGKLMLHNVFAGEGVTLDDVIAAFGAGISSVTLGFTPAETAGFESRELKEEDCTFFVKGNAFRDFGERRLRIPSLSHA